MKLNLGCGSDIRSDCINIDVRKTSEKTLVIDIEKDLLKAFPDNSVDEIIAKDFIEHISWRRVEDLIKDIHRVLKPGGRLFIQVPDLEAIAKRVILNPGFKYGDIEGFKAISFWIYGAQDYPENLHKSGFTIPTLKKLLETLNFHVEKIENDGGSNIICIAVKKK
jgi:ubiquinone/menaquinone biosynthesis C-methylase UbiE